MKIFLIRHAKTKANQEGRYVGVIDIPICHEGKTYAKGLTTFENVSHIYVSPMTRTRETASILFPKSKMTIINNLKEMDFGYFEGKNYDQLKNDPLYIEWVEKGGLSACPDGETPEGFECRVMDALREIMRDTFRKKSQSGAPRTAENDSHIGDAGDDRHNIYIVSHGGVIMTMMHKLTGGGKALFDFMSPNCGGWGFEIPSSWDDFENINFDSDDNKIIDYFSFKNTNEINRDA